MSKLTQTIALLYRMHDADQRKLADELLTMRKKAWATALRAEARKHGCNKTPNAPRREDLDELKRMCAEDAKSIVATWNRDVTRQIERIYEENRKSNRRTYFKRLEAWDQARRAWKLPQIALVTETTTAEYARERFRKQNYLGGQKYVFAGPPPTCEDCSRRFGAGIVTEAYIRKYPCPRHIGCPHTWEVVKVPKIKCADLWLG